MKRNNYKSRNWVFQYELERDARTIGELFPHVDHVEVEVSIHFETAVCKTTPHLFKRTLIPKDKVHLYYECVNPDCTGSGFSLTSALYECLQHNIIIEGSIRCDGKEDEKYKNATGCSCMTTCIYKLRPFAKD